MDPKFLKYYSRELTYMREMANEFSTQHPKIAGRLGMQGIDVADPYVERLIESFCFLSARTQLKMDAEFPRFTQRLLEVVYPNYVAPTPAMAVARLRPSLTEGDVLNGFKVPRHSTLKANIPMGEKTACEFRSGQDVTLWPAEIVEAKLTAVPPDIPDLERHLLPQAKLRGALRLRLRTIGDVQFSQLKGLDRLPVFINGDERIVSHLFEMIHAGTVASVVRRQGAPRGEGYVVSKDAIGFDGLSPDQGLLPLTWNTFHGHNLLHEYFACRNRFYFFSINNLSKGLSEVQSNEAEIVILLDRLPLSLVTHVDASRFQLFCTPIINLFPKRTDRIEVNRALTDFHLIPDRSQPLDYEIFSASRVLAQHGQNTAEIAFNPLYQTLHSDAGNNGRYFSVRRERRLISVDARKQGATTDHVGTEVFASLVDQAEAPYSDDIRYLSVDALVTNRDLPRLIPKNGINDLNMAESIPVDGVTLISPPSPSRAPFAQDETAWRLIRQLNFNYMPLSDLDDAVGGQALRNMLRLFVASGDREQNVQIDSLIGTSTKPVVRRLPGNGLLVYGRGVNCTLTIDETGFSGVSPYLLGVILEHYLARHVALNVFTETELHSVQRGLIARWPARMGGRGTV
ncbi:type VI secretion system baseplate subunit TssF [Glaciimonas immobilis]|uniref:Type VI secretion system protein ImpG n=1 Tax=Glaciimonas immobilis TaxID=728004 RepID=A0A840RRN0_9BURK|nr:type VI secretion system baseplate subunit TssF [Glaciimonas immobilis]KAF3998070.1 type VI secretion system baseplate subunit TssF [Glaciimonas immobilis]MBB5199240.1 type VI secretion system protein ImpG [Glaciimonas immobilis]